MRTQMNTFWGRARTALFLVLFAPFLALQTVAQGTMPTAGPDGFAMVLCTGDTTVNVVLLADGTIAPAEDQHDGLKCPWAISDLPTVEPDTPENSAFVVLPSRIEAATSDAGARIVAFVAIPPARAPPVPA